MKKRVWSLLLILASLLSVAPVSAFAAETPVEELYFQSENPLYAAYISEEAGVAAYAEEDTFALESPLLGDKLPAADYVPLETAVKQLRDAMVRRESPVVLYVNYTGQDDFKKWGNDQLFYAAMDMDHAEGATDGDYLRWSWQSMSAKAGHVGSKYAITFNLRYYTTGQQEREAIGKMERILSELGVDELTDYGKAAAIHQYVTGHVTYDHKGLEAMNEQQALHKKEDVETKYFLPYTAYAATINGTAVCQGYATMYYALCRMANLPVRLVASSNHAWNIVQIDGKWYSLDATADSETQSKVRWFLKGSKTFESAAAAGQHTRVAPYNSAEFMKQYPVGTEDYVPGTSYWDVRQDNGHIENIEKITKLGLMNGTGSAQRPTFAPLSTMQRGMLVTVLYRMEKEPAVSAEKVFDDVPAGRYYTEAVAWASSKGVVEGDGDGSFRPEADLTRQELVSILYRYASKVKGLDVSKKNDLAAYTDRGQLDTWAMEATRWSVGTEIVKGTSNTELSPRGNAKREQLATMLVRFLDYYGITPAA